MSERSQDTDESAMRSEIGKEMDRVSSIISKQLSDVIANSRWYSTLVVGEIAGIAKFAQTTHWWTFTVFILALISLFLSMIALIYSTVRAQELKYGIETTLAKLASSLPIIDFSGADTAKVREIREAVQNLFSAGENKSEALSLATFGLWSFLVGSIFGGLALLFG